ncbi:hypothetical protein [Bacillus toyonensis]|uniref:hypothetical protein n=1 Tax=Bacillus toyonensis TaxID=155322 RepID=UPI0027155E46|nr:hypothetical protein [Bacillus toyonensis]
MSDLLFEVIYIDSLGKTHKGTILATNETNAMTLLVIAYDAVTILKVVEIR